MNIKPDIIIEVSWEVCNVVGGIYTVLSTKAKTLQQSFKDKVLFIGPDLNNDIQSAYFTECKTPFSEWAEQLAATKGIKVRTGRWNVPGKPLALLVDFTPFWDTKDELYGNMWKWFGVESDKAYGDYDESCIFAYASAVVIEECYNYHNWKDKKVIAHFNEWTVGMGALHIKQTIPQIGTLFTTHATSIGRSIACNNRELYKYFNGYHGDQMAEELNMHAKHSLEKKTAHNVDCFTTVSNLTAKECQQLLEKEPDVVTPNAFEMNYVPLGDRFSKKRDAARKLLLKTVASLTGVTPSSDATLVGISGRYEYKNKGIDLFVDAISKLRSLSVDKEVIAFVMVPAWVDTLRTDLQERIKSRKSEKTTLPQPYITHWLHNMDEDNIVNHLKRCGLTNETESKIKIVFMPVYLTGNDGVFNKTYYDLLIGLDLTVFPSYYEPWGYTPLESIAFGVPTITTDKAGFGLWSSSEINTKSIEKGVLVIPRNDDNYFETVEMIAQTIADYTTFSDKQKKKSSENACHLAQKANWDNFIQYYLKAFSIALKKAGK